MHHGSSAALLSALSKFGSSSCVPWLCLKPLIFSAFPLPTFSFVEEAMPGAPSSFLLLVVRPGAPSSVLAPSSGARSP